MDSGFVKSFNYFDMSALSTLKANADQKKDETLKVVAQQMESVFLELVLKSMHEANSAMKSDFIDRDQEDFYQEMLNQQLSLSLSKSGGLGLSEVIYKQLKPKDTTPLPLFQNAAKLNELNVARKPIIELDNAPSSLQKNEEHPELVTRISLDPKVEGMKEFIEVLLPYAKKASEVIGLDPKLLLAQSALETGWGKHILQHDDGQSSHNLFGVKATHNWKGKHILAQTLEYTDNQPKKVKAPFKSYASYMESFVDYIKLLSNIRYEKALANTQDPKSFLTELKQAGYATDPNYVNKIMRIYEKFVSIE